MASRMSGHDLLVGLELGHYHVVEKIGAGGMGEVYRARDKHLDRDVAIKVLPTGTLTDASARKHFRKEALILSQLNHPNVATIHDFDTQQGVDFLVMEHIPGITLSEKVAAGPLTEKEVLRLGVQLAEGLAAAHDHGVVHRDLKPGNLRVTSDGRLKILDFGLAKLRLPVTASATTESFCETQAVAGTVPYMAPEQLLGGEIDARTDLHAAGSVLYEMATGQRPFAEVERSQLIGAILRRPPLSPTVLNPRLSPELERIIGKCLEKDAEDRYQSAKELAIDLRRLASPATSGGSALASLPVSKGRRLWIPACVGLTVLALIIISLAIDLGGIRKRMFGHGSTAIQAIAVLPLDNLSHDQEQEYFVDGMTDELITDLARIRGLRVISRTSVMHYKGTRKTLPEIARELHVDAVVEGSVLRDGNHLRVTAQLIYAPTDTHLWAESYQRETRDFWAVQNDLAHAIANEIRVNLTAQEQVHAATTHPATFAAHDAYLKGRYHLQQGTEDGMREAKAYFEEAARIDSNYAPAYAGLADYYWLTNELSPRVAMPKANEYVERALALDDSLADAHATLASVKFYGDWDWLGADKEFKRAIELSPSYAEAHRIYSEFLSEMGRHDQALAEIRTAEELDPLSATTILGVGWAFYYARDYDRAIEQCRKVLDLHPHSVSAGDCLGSAYLATAAYDQAIAEYSALVASSGNDPLRLASLGCAYALAGRKAQAQRVVGQLNAASKIHYVPPYFLGAVHAALGENDSAFLWLEKAYEQHDSYLVRLKVEPAMDPLRSDPRFEKLLHRMNL
jgi:eukaryotic-like serine/threonine-protein kinase